jgi:cytochrome d ubiquinol oxidase subunit II
METVWFVIVACMVATYVILDGFDLGVGAVYLLVARTNGERRAVTRTIGPVWDGNEVWLLAAGGTLYFAFPQLYATSFSGFYLPLMMVLWLLMLRAIGLEFRSHIDDPVWASFFDAIFSISSALLAVFFGAALGNVIRGVPIGADGYFFEPLWTDFRVSDHPGILDWYTVLAGIVALTALVQHGALYLVVKTENGIAERARSIVGKLWLLQVVLTVASLAATLVVQPAVLGNYKAFPLAFAIPVLVFGALAAIRWALAKGKERQAFLASCTYLAGMLVGAVYALYPVVLPARDASRSLTIYNAAAGHHGLSVGLAWWSFGIILALGYFVFIYRMFRGKVQVEPEGQG